MIQTRSRFSPRNILLLSVTFMICAIAMIAQSSPYCASAHASDTNPTDYCLSIEVDITNNTGSTLTNYPVRFEITAASLGSNGVLDERGWDIFPGIGSFATEAPLFAQDLDSNNSPWWTRINNLADGETQTVTLWMGNDEQRRDQGIYFSGNEIIEIPDNALIDGGEQMVELYMMNTDSTPREETIFDKNSGTAGIAAEFYDNAGTLAIRFIINNVAVDTCTANWNPSWTNEWITLNFAHVASVGSFTEINVNGSVVEICNGGSGNVSTNAIPWTVGDGTAGPLTGVTVRDFKIRCCTLSTSDPGNYIRPEQRALHLTFDANKMTETQNTLPYQGIIDDQSGNAIDATYQIGADQSDIQVVVNTPSLTSLTVGAVVDDELADITGQVLPDTIFQPGSKDTTSFIYTLLIAPLEDLFPMEWQGPTLFFFALGAVFAIIVARKTEWEFPVLYLFLFGAPVGAAAYNGWVPWVFVLIWGLMVFTVWTGLIRMIKEAF